MFILDTNVVSELMRPTPNPIVVDWVAGHAAANLFFSAVGEDARLLPNDRVSRRENPSR